LMLSLLSSRALRRSCEVFLSANRSPNTRNRQ
jgi:hypothetical protein